MYYQPMPKEQREAKLSDLQLDEKNIVMTGVRLDYDGQNRIFNVYRIPVSDLVYNPYNGRIGTRVKTYETREHKLNPELKTDAKIIEDFLWNSKIDKNKKTQTSLLSEGQQQYGIVSKDGIIVDGNRRASIINKIFTERESIKKNDAAHSRIDFDTFKYFNAVILPDNATAKIILKLEAQFQLGRDEKLDYNPIEKYLKTRGLLNVGQYSKGDIATMMDITQADVTKNLSILETMDEYLEQFDYDGLYSMLDGREDQLINLNADLGKYQKSGKNTYTDWQFDDEDLQELQDISFDYIRARYEGKQFRNIIQTGRKNKGGFFSNKKIWDRFKKQHENQIMPVTESEQSVDSYLASDTENHNEDISPRLIARDDDWRKKVISSLTNNMSYSVHQLEDEKDEQKPEELLERVYTMLSIIEKSNSAVLEDERCEQLIRDINSKASKIKKDKVDRKVN